EYSAPSMRRRMHAALVRTGLPNLGELQHRLLNDMSVFGSVLDSLTIQVSDMFRDPGFYAAFRTQVLPFLRTYPQIKIWHAGCAGGEEVYATAIMLAEEGLYERAQIYATDLSLSALERAKEAVYPLSDAKRFAENYRAAQGAKSFDEYFSEAYGRAAV